MRRTILAALAVTVLPTIAEAQNCRVIGNSYFCSDGRAGQRERPNLLNVVPNGNRLDADRYTPDATNAMRRGDKLFVEPNRLRRSQRANRVAPPELPLPFPRQRGINRIGPQTLNPDGSSCTVLGNQMSCY